MPVRSGSMRNRPVSPVRFGLVALACLSFVAACGSDDDSSESEDATESDEAQPAAVAAGYADLLAAMTELSADPVSATEDALDEVEETWESFEDAVKEVDSDAHEASEEALDRFLDAGEDGNAVAMGEATAELSATAEAYLAANPG
jgi:hypothetical protein